MTVSENRNMHQVMGIEMISVGASVPSRHVTNDDLSKLIDTSDSWIYPRTGIHSRYFCSDSESALTLSIEAGRQAIERAGIDKNRIGAVVVASMTPDFATPSIACMVQSELGLPEGIPALDLNAACSGFVYALEVARGLLSAHVGSDSMAKLKKETDEPGTDAGIYGQEEDKCIDRDLALVIGAEQLSRLLEIEDRTTSVLFGDGAGAAVVKLSADTNYDTILGSAGTKDILAPGTYTGAVAKEATHMLMDGKAVFCFAVDVLPKCIDALLARSGLTLDDIDFVVCHQANSRIIDHCVRRMKAPKEKFIKNMENFGNTSGASIPLALSGMKDQGLLKDGQKLILVGFGGGLTWGGTLLEYKEN